ACHRIDLSIRTEKADDRLRLLERLDQPIKQNAVKTTIVPTNAVVVVLEEGVHDRPQLPCCSRDRSGYFCLSDRLRPRYPVSPDTLAHPQARGISRAEPLASWLCEAAEQHHRNAGSPGEPAQAARQTNEKFGVLEPARSLLQRPVAGFVRLCRRRRARWNKWRNSAWAPIRSVSNRMLPVSRSAMRARHSRSAAGNITRQPSLKSNRTPLGSI